MVQEKTWLSYLCNSLNYLFLGFLALVCVLPIIHVLAISLSDSTSTAANLVWLIPIHFNLVNYLFILHNSMFFHSFGVSVGRVLAGTFLNLLLITLTAYPLSREPEELRGRNFVMWFLVLPMLFSGGMIPTFLVIRNVGLLNNYLSLILPTAVPIFSVILMMNFFRALPKSLFESAMMDGANHWTILTRIYIPLSMASVATLTLFSIVTHWNSWFDALIYLNDDKMWPLQTLLQSIILQSQNLQANADNPELIQFMSNRSMIAAQVFIAVFPILCIYPFLQKYFISGIVLGSVKE